MIRSQIPLSLNPIPGSAPGRGGRPAGHERPCCQSSPGRRRSGLQESAITGAYSAFSSPPEMTENLCWIASVLMLRFPKDVRNIRFGCSETADI